MWRIVFVLGLFFTSLFEVGAEGLGDAKGGAAMGKEVEQYSWDYEYDEATIKDKVIRDFLWVFDEENLFPNFELGTTIYDTKHGMVMTVVLLPSKKVEELYEKRRNARNVKASYEVFYGSMAFRDARRFEGRKLARSTFFKI